MHRSLRAFSIEEIMKIAICTMGTRGDVQPYIYLVRALQKNGHTVTIGSHPTWRNLVTESGVLFRPVGKDISIEKEVAVIRGKTANPALSMLKTMNFVFRMIEESTDEIYALCKESDAVIVSHSLMAATEAEKLAKKTVTVVLQTQMLPLVKKEKTFTDILFASLINPHMVKPYNRIRKRYGLPLLKSMDNALSSTVLVPISPVVVKPNEYWGDNVCMTGYWVAGNDEPYEPPLALKTFLESGEKPIVLSLGAMSFEEKPCIQKLDMFVKAFEKCKMRAIIQGFNESIQQYKLPDTMIHVGSVPHRYLFASAYAVIHHCGFGTSVASLVSGIPAVPIPHVLDQMGFADQMFSAGVAVQPIPAKALSTERLISALDELQANYAQLKDRAQKTAQVIGSENGLAKAVDIIEKALITE